MSDRRLAQGACRLKEHLAKAYAGRLAMLGCTSGLLVKPLRDRWRSSGSRSARTS